MTDRSWCSLFYIIAIKNIHDLLCRVWWPNDGQKIWFVGLMNIIKWSRPLLTYNLLLVSIRSRLFHTPRVKSWFCTNMAWLNYNCNSFVGPSKMPTEIAEYLSKQFKSGVRWLGWAIFVARRWHFGRSWRGFRWYGRLSGRRCINCVPSVDPLSEVSTGHRVGRRRCGGWQRGGQWFSRGWWDVFWCVMLADFVWTNSLAIVKMTDVSATCEIRSVECVVYCSVKQVCKSVMVITNVQK